MGASEPSTVGEEGRAKRGGQREIRDRIEGKGQEERRLDSLRLDVILDLLETPLDQRVDLDQSSPIDLNYWQRSSFRPLRASSSREDRFRTQLCIGPMRRLDLRGRTFKTDEHGATSQNSRLCRRQSGMGRRN